MFEEQTHFGEVKNEKERKISPSGGMLQISRIAVWFGNGKQDMCSVQVSSICVSAKRIVCVCVRERASGSGKTHGGYVELGRAVATVIC